MGEARVKLSSNKKQLQLFEKHLLNDIHALETMLRDGWFEIDVTRIGAEQEFCLVDKNWKLAPVGPQILKKLDDPLFTHELAKFNLEANLPPLEFKNNCFSEMENITLDMMQRAEAVAREFDVHTIMSGIVPSIRKYDLSNENITPMERYFALCKAIEKLRGGAFELRISGIDDLVVKHDSALIEAANTGFQVHLQIVPDEFVKMYNIAQAITGPVMAASTFSPILLRKRLWSETRVALFQQSVDTRTTSDHLREMAPRVTFGTQWLQDSILDVYKEDIVRYRIILNSEVNEDVFAKMKSGEAPELMALKVHNSTVYRWNRACYGVGNGKAHLRIENRIFPAGPTIVDEIANAAFWCGLMIGMRDRIDDVRDLMAFEDAKKNFIDAARTGLDTNFTWFNEQMVHARDLILEELLPVSREGLKTMKITKKDIDKYLGVIEDRVTTGFTGSRWMLKSYNNLMKQDTTNEEVFSALTAAIVKRQSDNTPVHEWDVAVDKDIADWEPTGMLVEEFMTKDLITVQKDDIIPLVAEMIHWKRIRYVLVEDDKDHLIGLVSSRTLLKEYTKHVHQEGDLAVSVKDIMINKPMTVGPDDSIMEAMEIMEKYQIGCLPVVKNNKLVGVVTESDFLKISSRLIKRLKNHI